MVPSDSDVKRGQVVAARLRELGIRGVLISAAAQGYITELACQVPGCLCPPELGGTEYFEPVSRGLTDWMPSADHHPVLKKDGGHRTVDKRPTGPSLVQQGRLLEGHRPTA